MDYIKILLLTCCFQLHAFKLDRVILATDANPDYIQFWPIVARAWREIVGLQPTLALIANKDVQVDESLGDVIRFEPIEGIPTSFQAQVIRLLLPVYFPDDGCIISDIDMIPLQKSYFIDSIKNYADDLFIIYRDQAYYAHYKRFPMCYIAAKGRTFAELHQPALTTKDIAQTMKNWHEQGLGWYTDELIFYNLITNWKDYNRRCIKLGQWVTKRVDRGYWTWDERLLAAGDYIDAHCPRPYSAHKDSIDRLVAKLFEPKIKKRHLEHAGSATHMAALLTVVMHTDGPVLEMGAGDFSTPLLHAICAKTKRLLLTADTDKRWFSNFKDLQTDWHQFQYVPVYEDDWSKNPQPQLWDQAACNMHWSVVLINHRPGERRVEDIRRLRNSTDIFVVHDTEQPSYGYEPLLSSFKYRYIYDRYTIQTTIVSDTIDVAKLFEQ